MREEMEAEMEGRVGEERRWRRGGGERRARSLVMMGGGFCSVSEKRAEGRFCSRLRRGGEKEISAL